MKSLLVILVIAVAIFLGVRWYTSRPASGGSGGSNPVIVNPVSSFPNPYAT